MAEAGRATSVLDNDTVDSEANLRPFLDTLTAQSFDDWRLIAIDNAFPDGSTAILGERHDPRISLICNRTNVGFARAANQGLKMALSAGAERMILMNNDVSFDENFLNRFMQIWSESSAQVITPRIMLQSHPEQAWYAGGHLEHRWVFRNIHEDYDRANPPHGGKWTTLAVAASVSEAMFWIWSVYLTNAFLSIGRIPIFVCG